MLTLISASPSPYARKIRIALQDKNVPFELKTEVPWDSTTITPQYNPLEKLPILIFPPKSSSSASDGGSQAVNGDATSTVPDRDEKEEAVFESNHILDVIEVRFPDPALYPSGPEARLAAKEIEVVADGIADALVILFFERQRSKEKQSEEWAARQHRKAVGGLAWLAKKVDESGADGENGFMTRKNANNPQSSFYGLADIAVGCCLGWIEVRWNGLGWREKHPQLLKYWENLEKRSSFKETRPSPQSFKDKIV